MALLSLQGAYVGSTAAFCYPDSIAFSGALCRWFGRQIVRDKVSAAGFAEAPSVMETGAYSL